MAKAMVKRRMNQPDATVGEDKAYEIRDFVAALRQCKVTPHVEKQKARRLIGESCGTPAIGRALPSVCGSKKSSAARRRPAHFAKPEFPVETELPPAPLTDPCERHYHTRLLPRILTRDRPEGRGWIPSEVAGTSLKFS
jgi:hypothetical protein